MDWLLLLWFFLKHTTMNTWIILCTDWLGKFVLLFGMRKVFFLLFTATSGIGNVNMNGVWCRHQTMWEKFGKKWTCWSFWQGVVKQDSTVSTVKLYMRKRNVRSDTCIIPDAPVSVRSDHFYAGNTVGWSLTPPSELPSMDKLKMPLTVTCLHWAPGILYFTVV